jgi:hypothetical protein
MFQTDRFHVFLATIKNLTTSRLEELAVGIAKEKAEAESLMKDAPTLTAMAIFSQRCDELDLASCAVEQLLRTRR